MRDQDNGNGMQAGCYYNKWVADWRVLSAEQLLKARESCPVIGQSLKSVKNRERGSF